jgi:hypothetical protein
MPPTSPAARERIGIIVRDRYADAVLADPDAYSPLRRARAEARLTQRQLGELAGVSPRTVGDFELRKFGTAGPRTAQRAAVAAALGVSPEDIS